MIRVKMDLTKAYLKVAQLAGRSSNFIPKVSGRLDVAVRRLIKEQFDTEGASGGTPWLPLSRLYAFRKTQDGFRGRKILQRTRRLLESLTRPNDPDGFVRLSAKKFTRGSRVPWAAAHQFGLPDRNLPARPIIPDPLPQRWIDILRSICESYIVTGR